eukprot:5585191-Amphidinium_carterae.2
MLLEVKATGKYLCWTFPLPCPLAVLDRATGPALSANLQEQLTVPELAALRSLSPIVVDVHMRDTAQANLACDEILHSFAGVPKDPDDNDNEFNLRNDIGDAFCLRVACGAHGISNALGHALAVVPGCVRGIISCSLAMRPGGSPQLLRACLAEVLFRSAVFHVAEAPVAPDVRPLYRRAVMDLCFPASPKNVIRKANLDVLLNGDWTNPRVDVYVTTSACINKRKWANCVADLLLPAAIPVFPRRLSLSEPPH